MSGRAERSGLGGLEDEEGTLGPGGGTPRGLSGLGDWAPEGAQSPEVFPELVPVRRSSAEQEALLEEQARTGESDTDFSARLGIRRSTLHTWRTRARQRAGGAAQGTAPEARAPGAKGEAKRSGQQRQGGARREYSPEERRGAVEAFLKSGRTRVDFCRLWGCSTSSLDHWLRAYEMGGPKALEPKVRGPRVWPVATAEPGATVTGEPSTAAPAVGHEQEPAAPCRPHPNRLPEAVRDLIEATHQGAPHSGLRRVRDLLWRFAGIKVSAGTVKHVLDERGVVRERGPAPRVTRKPPQVRRFERAKPKELWQSDITSFVLARQQARVYLTVFLDDHSRYIVAWRLSMRQTADLVIEPLLEGIARFGKPKEVLTDQGRQYFAWRGKSGFQKLLLKEGIQHVVSRAHHPETLGKCERLWRTIHEEFWSRAGPADLSDARERLGHYLVHYNHFRPHQGIDGLVPADRFFEAGAPLRQTLEASLAQNELDLALGRAPRPKVYFFGQVGDRQISLHGEQGSLVIETPDGVRQELLLEGRAALEQPASKAAHDSNPSNAKEQSSSAFESTPSTKDPHGTPRNPPFTGTPAFDSRFDGSESSSKDRAGGTDTAPPQTHRPQADGVFSAALLPRAGPAAVALGGEGGAAKSASDLRFDPRVLAREEVEERGGGGAVAAGLAGLAAEPSGLVGDAGGALEAAAGAAGPGPNLGRGAGGRSEAAQKGGFEAEDGAFPDGGLGAGLADGAVAAGKRGGGRRALFAPKAEGGPACSQERSQEGSQDRSQAESEAQRAERRARAPEPGGANEDRSSPKRPSGRAAGGSTSLSAFDKARSRAALGEILAGAKRWLNRWR